jgi:hypothetical protein
VRVVILALLRLTLAALLAWGGYRAFQHSSIGSVAVGALLEVVALVTLILFVVAVAAVRDSHT